ncbi:MAG: alpha/beta fold hydrolase [Leptospiraceae bacterium]|nr:alpha/beta fold hydrolase [Leptospiraceae bacterium]MCP5494654.1 alpha/beta fold hydrolase [Leptospiraceae bacterium]
MNKVDNITFFKPRKFLTDKHLQTVVSVLFPPKNILNTDFQYEEIPLPTPDASGDMLLLEHNPPVSNYQDAKTQYNGYYLILVHGMEGDSDSHYMISIGEDALENGYGVVRMNMRGCGRGEGMAKGIYNAGKTDDLDAVVSYVYKNFSKKIILSGFSLSANIVLKYLGEKKRTKVKFFSAVSPPLDLKDCCEHIDSPQATFYRNRFLRSFKKRLSDGIIHLPETINKELAYEAKTLFDFDDVVSGPLAGYKSALDYYKKCSSINFLYSIPQKGIVVHADDDPLIPVQVFHKVDWEKVPHITHVLTRGGGHVGFLTDKSDEIPDGRWLNYILLKFFNSQIQENILKKGNK